MQSDYVPCFIFRGGRTGNAGQYQTDRGPFTNENVTHDVIANITKVWGSHASKAGFYYQNSFKPQSIFASFNSQIDFTDNGEQPVRHGLQLRERGDRRVQQLHAGLQVRAAGMALPQLRVVRAGQLEAEQPAHARLRPAVLLPDAAVGHDAAGVELPARRSSIRPTRRRSSRRSASAASPCSDANRRGMDPALISAGRTPTLANTVDPRFIGRLTPGSDRFNGAFQAGQGINDQLQNGNAFRVSPRIGAVYDLTGKGETIVRGGFGIFYDRPQGNMVFDMIANAPGVLNSTLDLGTAAGPDARPVAIPTRRSG